MNNYKPIIGIVSRPIKSISNRNMFGVYETYQKAVTLNGGIPFSIIPPSVIKYIDGNNDKENTTEELNDLIRILKLVDGVILPGGDNGYYYDYFITDYCYKNNIPILGICLGMQIMYEYISNKKITKVDNHYLTEHSVYIDNNSILYKIFKKDIIIVNSRHKYQVEKSDNIPITAIANDGVIEAFEIKNKRFFLGVEWHPEDLKDNDILFSYFISKCKVEK